MRGWVLTFLWMTAAAMAEAQAPRVLTLAQAIRTAQLKQPQMRQARAATAAANARVDQARAPLFPQASATASYQRTTANFVARPSSVPRSLGSTADPSFDTFDFFNFGVSVNQLVYDFGQTTGRLDAAQENARVQRHGERTTALDIVANVRNAYFQARARKALLVVAEQTLANQERHLRQIQGFVEVGTRPPIDLAQARTDRANANVQMINAQNAYENAKALLNQAMGVEGSTGYDVADDTLSAVRGEERTTEQLLTDALRARPEFAAMTSQVRAQEASAGAIEGAYGPSVNVSTAFTEAGAQLDALAWNWNAGVSVSWPFFQGGVTRAQVAEARANLANLRAQQDALKQRVRLELDQARLSVRAAKAALEAAAEAATNARERLRLAEGRYETGVGNVIELGDAQLALTNAEAQKVQADYNLATARAQLLRALGRTGTGS